MKRVESVISICLLGVLFLIGAAIFLKQYLSVNDMSRFGIDTKSHTIVLRDEEWFNFILTFLSTYEEYVEIFGEIETYNSDTLYEKINGKAPIYLEAGFEELFTQRFASINDSELWMEVYLYDMGSIRNAFSVYSVQRRAESEPFANAEFGYKTSNALYFVQGKYYIEIIGSAESEELLTAMEKVAQTLQTNLDVGDTEIAEFKMFPQENLIPDSFKLYTVSAFGFEGLTDTFTAKYKFGGESVTAFLSKRENPKEAEQVAESYRNFLIENGAIIKNTDNKMLEGKVMDLFGTTEIVFTVGPFLAGVHEAENQQTAEKLAEMLINRLNNE